MPRRVVAGAVAGLVAYAVWRSLVLRGIGGYTEIAPAQIGRNLAAAAAHVIAPGYHGQPALAAASVLLLALALGVAVVMWRRAPDQARARPSFVLGSALAIAAVLPLSLSAGPTRGHHLLMAAALLIGALAAMLRARAALAGLAIPVWMVVAVDARMALAPCALAARVTSHEMMRYGDELPAFSRRALETEMRRCRGDQRPE